jgi:SPP1 family predicted phage head-tail adaptor
MNLNNSFKIAKLDRKITIKTTTQTQSGSGAAINTFADLATVWANIKNAGSIGLKGEKFNNDRENVFNKKVFTIRYRSDFDEKAIIVFETKEYDILGINEMDDTRKRFLQITAERRE